MTLLGAVLALSLGAGAVEAAQIALGEQPPVWGPAQSEAEIGQPVEWTLEIVHARRARPEIISEQLEEQLDRTWVFLSGPVIQTWPVDGASEEEHSTFTWSLMALESGERSAPSLLLQADSGEQLEVLSETLLVSPALIDGEDVPRPFAEFHDIEGGAVGSLTTLFGILIGLAVLCIVAVVLLVRRARRRAVADLPAFPIAPRAAFDALRAGRADDADGVQRLAFELTGILQRALAGGEPGCTDQEWFDALRAGSRLAPDVLVRVEALVSTCEQIKYGGQVPTRFAIDELLDNADKILKDVDRVQAAASNLEAVG
ncbi:MAG: hypothetical protein ACI8QZ_001115 [Chlamydiales bacterium]|jgi:hypothetical protein